MLQHRFTAALALLCLCVSVSYAQTQPDSLKNKPVAAAPVPPAPASSAPSAKWYDKISLRGYAQMRYNRLFENNDELRCEQCDKSIGKNQGFTFRRARLILSGEVHERFSIYIQFDYSSDASATSKHFLQVRDAYFDYALNKKKEFRFRFGQSKVPFGFDNLQSSSNRLAFDRTDGINSAVPNERDMGAYIMYTPKVIQTRFKSLVEHGLKGTGDYGVFSFGAYNGQITNKPELNDNLHVVARAAYPFKVGPKQIVEAGIQAYSGLFTLASDQLSSGVKVLTNRTYTDQRIGVSAVLYAQPFGIQAEYNAGKSPSFDALTDSIRVQNLNGGYIQFSYRMPVNHSFFQPFVRFQQYEGAKKHELDARYYRMHETEIGLEWQVIKNMEITLSYAMSNRKYSDFKTDYNEGGHFLRIQFQANY
jgi:phosphate-selective porin